MYPAAHSSSIPRVLTAFLPARRIPHSLASMYRPLIITNTGTPKRHRELSRQGIHAPSAPGAAALIRAAALWSMATAKEAAIRSTSVSVW